MATVLIRAVDITSRSRILGYLPSVNLKKEGLPSVALVEEGGYGYGFNKGSGYYES